jgi:hypothetical protein
VKRADPALYMVSAYCSADCAQLIAAPRAVQLVWAKRAGMDMKASESTFEDKKEYHELLRAKHGMQGKAKKKEEEAPMSDFKED